MALKLSDSFNRINESVVLTEGKTAKRLDDIVPFGRTDKTLRSWTVQKDLCEEFPPTPETVKENGLLQAILDTAHKKDSEINIFLASIKELAKSYRAVSDALYQEVWTEIGIETKISVYNNHKKLAEFAKEYNQEMAKKKIVIKKAREYGSREKQKRDQRKKELADQNEVLSMMCESTSSFKLMGAAHYLTLLTEYHKLRKSLKITVQNGTSILTHAKVQGTVLARFLPQIIECEALMDLQIFYGGVNVYDNVPSPYIIEWESHWSIEAQGLQKPSEILLPEQSSATGDLIEIGQKLLTSNSILKRFNNALKEGSELIGDIDNQDPLPTRAEVEEVISQSDVDLLVLLPAIDHLSTMANELQDLSERIKDIYTDHITNLRAVLDKFNRNRELILRSIKVATLKPMTNWPNRHFGESSLIEKQKCRAHLQWLINKEDPMMFEDSNLVEGSCYQGIRIFLESADHQPWKWNFAYATNKNGEETTEPATAGKKSDKVALEGVIGWNELKNQAKRIEIDACFQRRVWYLVEGLSNNLSRELWPCPSTDLKKEYPVRLVKNSDSDLATAIDLLPAVQKEVSRLLYNATWLIRDFRCMIVGTDVDLMRYIPGRVIPFQSPKNEFIFFRYVIDSLRLKEKFGVKCSARRVWSAGRFYVSVKCDLTESLAHGGRFVFGLKSAKVAFQSWYGIQQDQIFRKRKEVIDITADLNWQIDSCLNQLLYSLPKPEDCHDQFHVSMIPTEKIIAANICDRYLLCRFLEEVLDHVLN